MRSFGFTAKNMGEERYLTYIMGEGCELDEDALDICEEGVSGLVDIIYEEDDDFDYLTYDISGKMTVDSFSKGPMDKSKVLTLIRNVAMGIIDIKEQGIPLAYVLLNRKFMYVDPDTLGIQYLCVPIESEGSVAAEFKGFVRQFIANLVFNVDEDLGYVGQLLTYINGDSFNLRGLIGLVEALMKDSGINFDGTSSDIATADGDVVVNTEAAKEEGGVSSFMEELPDAGDTLPEIGDDEEEEEELEEIEAVEEPAEEPAAEAVEEDDDDAPETVTIADIRAAQKSVKVNRAALIQKNAKAEAETETLTEDEQEAADQAAKASEISSKSKNKERKKNNEVNEIVEAPVEPAANANAAANIIQATSGGTIKINPYLVRETTEEKIIINKDVFKIGKANRGVDYKIQGNGAISRIHAIIALKDNAYYIKDNKSTNHTYVNNVQLEDDQELMLTDNCRITFGDEDFIFKLR